MHAVPYNNAYHTQIAQQVRILSQIHVNRDKDIPDFAAKKRCLRKGSRPCYDGGFAASSATDLGFEPTYRATSPNAKPRRARQNTIKVGAGLTAAGISAGRVSAGDVSAGAAQRT